MRKPVVVITTPKDSKLLVRLEMSQELFAAALTRNLGGWNDDSARGISIRFEREENGVVFLRVKTGNAELLFELNECSGDVILLIGDDSFRISREIG